MNNKFLAFVSVVALAVCALGGVMMLSDDSDAVIDSDYGVYTGGSHYSPLDTNGYYSGIQITSFSSFRGYCSSEGSAVPLLVGSFVSITGSLTSWGATDITSGFGLSVSDGSITGTVTKTGLITVDVHKSDSVPYDGTYQAYILVVSVEDEIDFTSPAAVEGISGGSINYTAKTNIAATYSETGGTGASWLSVNSASGLVTGTFPSVTNKTSYTYTIKATSKTNSSNTITQTITIDVYPVAKISASSTTINGTENEAISSVSLNGNLAMTFSKSSGTWPAGISMTSAGVISGTPTESGSFTVVVRGNTSVGPAQTPTITMKFNIEAAELTLAIDVSAPGVSYKVGESVSLDLSSNVAGTIYVVTGTAASFMSVSGSKVVGSVPVSYSEVTELSLTVTGTSPKGQTASKTVSFSVEPIISFTTVPTADCIITPVYSYDENGNPTAGSPGTSVHSLIMEVDAATSADFTFTDTLKVLATFTGTNAETVTWYWGDGSSDVGNKITHVYEKPGTYEIRLVASNELGESEVTITVSVGSGSPDYMFYIVIVVLVLVIAYLAHMCTSHRRH